MKISLGSHTYHLTTPVLLVGTYDKNDKPNLMTAAWGGICCSEPKCISVSLRKATYSYSAIMERKAFTIGTPMHTQVAEADYIGIVSGREINKFETCGYTPVKSDVVDAPYAKEIPLVMECSLLQAVDLGLHTMFVGEIIDIKAEESVLDEKGRPDINIIKPFIFNSIDKNYYSTTTEVGKGFRTGQTLISK